MILYMRTERTGWRRTALIAASLAVVLGAWWLWDDTPAPEASNAPLAQATAQAAHPIRFSPPAIASLLESQPETAARRQVQAAAVSMPHVADDAVPVPVPMAAPAQPLLPTTPLRGEYEPE